MATTSTAELSSTGLAEYYRAVRARTHELVRPLSAEDMMVQSCTEASPAKWHLAHTAWFFESFVLREFLPGYQVFNKDFAWLFNSYYQTFAAFPEKHLRASFSRPGLAEVLRYRLHVDGGVARLLEGNPPAEALARIEIGLNHEEQHQELLLTDILHAFFTNPLQPAYQVMTPEQATPAEPLRFVEFDGGLHEVGHRGSGFSFDNELPRHRVWLESYRLANRLVTCAEFAEFIADGGYRRPELWLSDGWSAVQANGWRAPLYWSGPGLSEPGASDRNGWTVFTLGGEMRFEQVANAPVSHVSLYEADAWARWAGYRLPTEFEWEAAAQNYPVAGNFHSSGFFSPRPAGSSVQDGCDEDGSRCCGQDGESLAQLFGDCWEWTASAYLPWPGFRPLPGSLGEYNGKFMSGQMVLRGGSCVTPAGHIRASYRNFFTPATRWQFAGIRLAE